MFSSTEVIPAPLVRILLVLNPTVYYTVYDSLQDLIHKQINPAHIILCLQTLSIYLTLWH
jgi:hypothetical protein